jgi:hypothetical protein
LLKKKKEKKNSSLNIHGNYLKVSLLFRETNIDVKKRKKKKKKKKKGYLFLIFI